MKSGDGAAAKSGEPTTQATEIRPQVSMEGRGRNVKRVVFVCLAQRSHRGGIVWKNNRKLAAATEFIGRPETGRLSANCVTGIAPRASLDSLFPSRPIDPRPYWMSIRVRTADILDLSR
jgi:hypothetical protein